MSELTAASESLNSFRGATFCQTVAGLERRFTGRSGENVMQELSAAAVTKELLLAALLVKKNASQIDEIVHTLGILLALPHLLKRDEQVESLSLAAGNTGKGFDLETNKRIAEFTFIQWQGGPEVIRQNKIFKDFYFLAETDTHKKRELFVWGTEQPLRFFRGGRAIQQILDGNAKLGKSFRHKYGTGDASRFSTVSEYYAIKERAVTICDLTPLLLLE